MELLSLPKHLQLDIFSNVDWKSIINVKSVCKELNILIEQNIQRLQRPKIYFMDIDYGRQINSSSEIIVSYAICRDEQENGTNYNFRRETKKIFFSNLNSYEDFLRKNDFSRLNQLCFDIDKNTEVVRLFNNYFNGGEHLKDVNFYDYGGEERRDANDVLEFIHKTRNTEYMSLVLNFPNQEMPKNFVFPVMNSLNRLYIEEKNGTKFMTKEIMRGIINNSGDNFALAISFQDEGIYSDVAGYFIRKVSTSMDNKCIGESSTPRVIFYVTKPLSFGDVRFFRSLFERYYFIFNHTFFSSTEHEFTGHKECHWCGSYHAVKFYFDSFFD
uniref:F-box domain-containing protein n=1 Tax=Strongyloides papillosus TaxID=174720 RepID=A0A0N5BQE1_STREA